MSYILSHNRELLIGFCTLLIVSISFIFPQKSFGETFWLSLVFFAVFPILVILFLLKEPLKNFGLSLGSRRKGIVFSAAVVIIFVLLNYYLVFHSGFRSQLFLPLGAAGGFLNFLAFEFFIALPLHFFWEAFYRGFLQMGLEKKLGIFSLILAVVLQTLLSFGGNWATILLVFLSSLAAGLIVRQSRSIVYSAASLWIISVSLDIMLIRLINSGTP